MNRVPRASHNDRRVDYSTTVTGASISERRQWLALCEPATTATRLDQIRARFESTHDGRWCASPIMNFSMINVSGLYTDRNA